jgi:deazaflavin-dependent oxidoreductase (nitroreductase family)
MTAAAQQSNTTDRLETPKPRFGGVLRRVSGATNPLMVRMAGSRWNPVFAVVEHLGRKSGRLYRAPVAARRVDGGFVISLAFGAQVDWYRNMIAAQGGTIRWRDQSYQVACPERIDASTALAAFNPIQRAFMRLARIDGYVRLLDVHADS